MTLAEYQRLAAKTAVYPQSAVVAYPVAGLASEAGEVAGVFARVLMNSGDMTEEHRHKMIREMGDVLWNLAALATDLGVTLDDVAAVNLEKLAKRLEKGLIKGEGDDRENADTEEGSARADYFGDAEQRDVDGDEDFKL